MTSHPRSTVVLLDTGTRGTSGAIYSEDAKGEARWLEHWVCNPGVASSSLTFGKGLIISQLLSEQMVKLVTPLFLTSERSQFEEAEVQDTQQIARLRIHVERAIRSIEENHLFDRVLPLSLAGTINQIWTASCLLTNFKGPLF